MQLSQAKWNHAFAVAGDNYFRYLLPMHTVKDGYQDDSD